MRDFNTAGPVRPRLHYCVPPLDRLNAAELLHLIRAERYFVLHAPRQTGKTTALLALRDLLNDGAAGEYRCAYLNVEPAQTAREDVGRGMGAIASEIAREARNTLNDPATAEAADRLDTTRRPDAALGMLLETWARAADSPLVVLIDEIDALVGDTLVSALRQLRAGYAHRPAGFPQSVVLCGDQEFSPGALDAVWEQTGGQPWLVNAVGRQLCFEHQALRPRDRPISERDVFEARETLILRRDTHIDQLADKLREPRVRRVIEPLLSGGDGKYSDRDREYVRDLGLVAPDAPLRLANPIYAEVVPRELTWVLQDEMPRRTAWYVDADGGLDMGKLLAAFQDFFRRNSEHWVQRAQYTEAGPQLVLQAFLHRVVNGRGRIEREYALGSRRVDLLVVWPGGQGRPGRFVVECKLLRDGRSQARTVGRGLEQTAAYMDLSAADAGHLVIFDMREGRTRAEKIYREERQQDGTPVTVWGA